MKDIKVSIDRLNGFLNSFDQASLEKTIVLDEVESIKLYQVSFGYNGDTLFESLDLDAQKGDIVSILGPNGCGKSTLTNIIMGLYEVDGATINGFDFKSTINIHHHVAHVEQKPYMMPDTIMNNITCFDDTKKERVEEVINDLKLYTVFERLDKGLETMITEDGSNLSGGETQIIALLRALVSDREVIILDEYNSALDVVHRERLSVLLKPYLEDKIVFLISHQEEIHNISNRSIDIRSYAVWS